MEGRAPFTENYRRKEPGLTKLVSQIVLRQSEKQAISTRAAGMLGAWHKSVGSERDWSLPLVSKNRLGRT